MSLWRRIYTERRAVVLPVLGLLVVTVGVLVLAVVPLRQSVAGYQDAAANAAQQLKSAQMLDAGAKAARTKKEQADQELQKFYAEILPTKVSAWSAVNFSLQTAARESNLIYKANTYDEPESLKDSQLVRIKGHVTLIGDYASIRRFLYAIETSQEFVIINRVGLSQVSQANSNGDLEVVLDVETYYRSGDQSAGGRP